MCIVTSKLHLSQRMNILEWNLAGENACSTTASHEYLWLGRISMLSQNLCRRIVNDGSENGKFSAPANAIFLFNFVRTMIDA